MANDIASILVDVLKELNRADEKHGRGEGMPFVDLDLMNRHGRCTSGRMADEYEIPNVARARFLYSVADQHGTLTHAHILVEELAECIDAAVIDPGGLRAELVQLAAMAIKGIRELDRVAKEKRCSDD